MHNIAYPSKKDVKKGFSAILILLISASLLSAQGEWPDRKGKLFLVPEFGLSFGSSTYIEISPMIGYHVMDRLTVGVGPHYIYQKQKVAPSYPVDFESHVFGMRAFGRFALITHAEEFIPLNLFSDLFVHVEYEGMSLEKDIYHYQGGEGRFLYHSILVGGGINQRLGPYNSVSLMMLWDINESTTSPYANPIFRIGFNTYF